MIKITFAEFKSGEYDDKNEGHVLYILRDDTRCLYVGISKRGAWTRWFDGWGSHYLVGARGLIPDSSVARWIDKNKPASDAWTVELWTRRDGVKYYRENEEEIADDLLPYLELRDIEDVVIRELRPCMNVSSNAHFQEVDTDAFDELRELHNRVFK